MKKIIEIDLEEIEECEICFTEVTANFILVIMNSRFGIQSKHILCYRCFGVMLYNFIEYNKQS